ncbi:MAG: rhomboid family intramembrane serine protease [Dokdonella sp.]
MSVAPVTPEPTAIGVAGDRARVRYALLGAFFLVAGIWLAWSGTWLLGWEIDDLAINPRHWFGLIGIITAPFAHGSFEHLMTNTLPLGLLAALALYAYPLAVRYALPTIWLLSGIAVWLFARPSLHIGISGIVHGLMFFLFVIGLLRRDRLGIAISLVVFFLYGGMVMTVLPREENISFEYHLAGALAGLISAIVFRNRDPKSIRKRYDWEDEEIEPDTDDELELPRPTDVPVLWRRESAIVEDNESDEDNVIAFPGRRRDGGPTIH